MPQEIQTLVLVLMVAIVASLGKAMFHMSSGPEQSARTLRALKVRITLSVALFLVLMAGWHFGLISPHTGP